jgi:hypothetical protein
MLQPIGEEVDAAAAPNLLALEISFEIVGGNVLINGRSSLQKQPKASKVGLSHFLHSIKPNPIACPAPISPFAMISSAGKDKKFLDIARVNLR